MDKIKTAEDARHILFSKGNMYTKLSSKLQALCKQTRDKGINDPRILDLTRSQIFECKKALEELGDILDYIEEDVQPSLDFGDEEEDANGDQ